MLSRIFFIVALLYAQSIFAQLSNFIFQVNVTHETCLGNGSLNFVVNNATPGSTLTYSVYLLPNTTTPIAITSNSTLTGLNAGNYQVVAAQSLGASSGSQQQNVTIQNAIPNLNFSIVGTRPKCGNDGVLTVNVNSGNVASYQIISGPITTNTQTTNVFNNLPAGQYQIRVVDVCGNALIQTYTLLQLNVGLNIDFGTVVPALVNCNTIAVSNYMAALSGSVVAYPLSIQYAVFPPGGGSPTVLNQILTGGNVATQNIPFYNNQQYYYNIFITDACGNNYTLNNNPVNRKFDVSIGVNQIDCSSKQLEIAPSFFISPYTVNFISYPAGFNPTLYNTSHPGPFSGDSVTYGGVGNSVPLGNYTIEVTDACGRTALKIITIQDIPVIPTYTASFDGCGKLNIILSGVLMQTVTMVSAPSGFPISLPYNVTSFINPVTHNLIMNGLMEGNYVFQIMDICGVMYTLNVTIPPYTPNAFTITQRPGCNLGYGSARIISDVNLNSATILSAPANFTGTLPLNLNIIVGNSFFLSNVPEGNYVIQSVNSCGALRTDTIIVVGYAQSLPNVVIQRNCGSFNLQFTPISNASGTIFYWLQKLDSATGNWIHPSNGTFYVNGSLPNTSNSILLNPAINNINLAFSGQFRILKSFQTYSPTGSSSDCIVEIYSFDINSGPIIESIYQFGCTNGNSEALVNAIGVAPLQYRITTKDGVPFLISNGTSNYFSDLVPGVYNFQVEDSCGNIVNRIIEITNLAPLQISSSVLCNNQNGSLTVPNFSFLTYQWWKENATSTILSTSNTLNFTPFNNPNDFGLYHVKIVNTLNPSSCLNTELTFNISDALNNPHAGNDRTVTFCENQGVLNLQNLLSGTYDSNGIWTELTNSNGSLIGSNWDTANVSFGTYQFSYQVNGFCSNSDEAIITVVLNEIPIISNVVSNVTICNNENVVLLANQNNPNYTYLWIGPNGFSLSNPDLEINNIQVNQSGQYTLQISNGNCTSLPFNVIINVNQTPEFLIENSCVENNRTLQILPINNSFDSQNVVITWSGPNGFISNDNPLNISQEAIGLFTVSVTEGNCASTNSIDITTIACEFPKGISPNGDGTNDNFDLTGFEVEELKIFNRYGREIYVQQNYIKEWYGQDFKGNLLPAATYYYEAKLKSGVTKTGWVYLQR